MASNMVMDTQQFAVREDTILESKTFKCFQCSFVCSDKKDLHLHMKDVRCNLGLQGNVSDRDKLKTLKREYTVKDTAQLMYNSIACRTGRTPNVTRKFAATYTVTKKQSYERRKSVGSDAVGTSNPTKHKEVQECYAQNLCGGNVSSESTNTSMTPFLTFKKHALTVEARHAGKLRRILQQQESRNRFTNILRIKMRTKLMEWGGTKHPPTVAMKKQKLAVEEEKKLLELKPNIQPLLYDSSSHTIAHNSQSVTGAHGYDSKCSATEKKDTKVFHRPSFPQGTRTLSSCVPMDLRVVKHTTPQPSTATGDEEIDLHRSRSPSFHNRTETGRAEHFGHHTMNTLEYIRQRSLGKALREVERCVCWDCRPAFLEGIQTIKRCHNELRRETQSRRVIDQ